MHRAHSCADGGASRGAAAGWPTSQEPRQLWPCEGRLGRKQVKETLRCQGAGADGAEASTSSGSTLQLKGGPGGRREKPAAASRCVAWWGKQLGAESGRACMHWGGWAGGEGAGIRRLAAALLLLLPAVRCGRWLGDSRAAVQLPMAPAGPGAAEAWRRQGLRLVLTAPGDHCAWRSLCMVLTAPGLGPRPGGGSSRRPGRPAWRHCQRPPGAAAPGTLPAAPPGPCGAC